MFPINLIRPSVSQAIFTPTVASSDHSNLSESLQCIKNIPKMENVPANVKPTLKKKLGLKLNFAVLAQQSAFDKLQVQTTKIINERGIEYDTQDRGQLYPAIGTAKKTQISIFNQQKMIATLAANQLQVGGEPLAIRCQYPKNNEQSIENHLLMLLTNNTPVLIILASKEEIKSSGIFNEKLPPYFMVNHKYGSIEVSSEKDKKKYKVEPGCNSAKDPLKFNEYKMTLSNTHKRHSIPVIHITNWADGDTASVEDLKKLNRIIETLKIGSLLDLYKHKGIRIDGDKRPLPVIHCKAGIGRTGVLAAAMQLTKKNNSLSVDDVVTALRTSGNANMVQTEAQYNTLLELQKLIQATRKMSS